MKIYPDYAAAEADLASLAESEQALILVDEGRNNTVACYHKEDVALIFEAASASGYIPFADPAPDAEYAEVLALIKVPPNLDEHGEDKAVDYTLAQIAKNYFESPPESETETYSSISFGRGWNIGANGLRANTMFVGFGHFEEYHYIQEGVVASEYQHRFYDLEGIEHRLWQTFMPHDWAAGGHLSTNQFSAGRHRLYDENDVPVVLYDLHNRTIDMRQGVITRYEVTDLPMAQQKNSEGTLVDLPFINAQDFLEQRQPYYLVTPPKSFGGLVTWRRHVLKDPVDGAYASVTFLFSAVEGSINQSYFAGDVSGNISATTVNTNATGGIRQKLISASGDLTMTTQIGSAYWIYGHKASDDSFRLSPTGFLGNTDALILEASGRVRARKFAITHPSPPASVTETGIAGQIEWDADYVYVCVAANTWKRLPLSSW